jgi:hypothetical protein
MRAPLQPAHDIMIWIHITLVQISRILHHLMTSPLVSSILSSCQ